MYVSKRCHYRLIVNEKVITLMGILYLVVIWPDNTGHFRRVVSVTSESIHLWMCRDENFGFTAVIQDILGKYVSKCHNRWCCVLNLGVPRCSVLGLKGYCVYIRPVRHIIKRFSWIHASSIDKWCPGLYVTKVNNNKTGRQPSPCLNVTFLKWKLRKSKIYSS